MIVRLGPFSEVHFSLLRQKLDAAGATFERIEDPELVNAYLSARKNVEVHLHPTYSGSMPEFIFLDIKKEYLMLIKKDLAVLGFSLIQADEAFSPEDELPVALPKRTKIYGRVFFILLVLAMFFILLRNAGLL